MQYPAKSANGGYPDRFPISTNSLTFFGSDMMLLMSFSDDKIYISYRDAVVGEDGKRKFPRPQNGDMKNTVTLTKERAAAFARRLNKCLVPKLEEFILEREQNPGFNKGYSIGVPTNTEMTNMLTLSTGNAEKGFYEPVLSYMKEIDMNTRMPAEIKSFTFSQKIPVFTDYDPKTGEYASQVPEYPQLIIFIEAINEFVKGQTKGALHGIESKYHDRYTDIRKTINQIAEKNGIPIPQNTTYNKGTPFSSQSSSQVPQPTELKPYNSELNLLAGLGEGISGDPNASPF